MIINLLIKRETTARKPTMGAKLRKRDYHGKNKD